MYTFNPKNLGEIQEREYGKWFTFRNTVDEWAKKNRLPHEIDVLDGVRYAKVLKTVAYVAVDEAPDGRAVIEKWTLKKFNAFVSHATA